jgi:hypothetical protein
VLPRVKVVDDDGGDPGEGEGDFLAEVCEGLDPPFWEAGSEGLVVGLDGGGVAAESKQKFTYMSSCGTN